MELCLEIAVPFWDRRSAERALAAYCDSRGIELYGRVEGWLRPVLRVTLVLSDHRVPQVRADLSVLLGRRVG